MGCCGSKDATPGKYAQESVVASTPTPQGIRDRVVLVLLLNKSKLPLTNNRNHCHHRHPHRRHRMTKRYSLHCLITTHEPPMICPFARETRSVAKRDVCPLNPPRSKYSTTLMAIGGKPSIVSRDSAVTSQATTLHRCKALKQRSTILISVV